MTDRLDAPNQQVVRADGSGPSQEGSGATTAPESTAGDDLDAMTKDELLAYAQQHGVDVDAGSRKDDIRQAIKDAA
jgi:hypothetical protein